MSGAVQETRPGAENGLWSRAIKVFSAFARKASLANIIDIANSRLIGFLLRHGIVRAVVLKLLGGMLDRFLQNDPTNPRTVRAQRVAMGRALLRAIARLFSAAQKK